MVKLAYICCWHCIESSTHKCVLIVGYHLI